MKKILSLLLALFLVLLSFAACNKAGGDPEMPDDGTSAESPDSDSTPDDPGTEEQAARPIRCRSGAKRVRS